MDDCHRVNSTGKKSIEYDISVNVVYKGNWDNGLFWNVLINDSPEECRGKQVGAQKCHCIVLDSHCFVVLNIFYFTLLGVLV